MAPRICPLLHAGPLTAPASVFQGALAANHAGWNDGHPLSAGAAGASHLQALAMRSSWSAGATIPGLAALALGSSTSGSGPPTGAGLAGLASHASTPGPLAAMRMPSGLGSQVPTPSGSLAPAGSVEHGGLSHEASQAQMYYMAQAQAHMYGAAMPAPLPEGGDDAMDLGADLGADLPLGDDLGDLAELPPFEPADLALLHHASPRSFANARAAAEAARGAGLMAPGADDTTMVDNAAF